MSSNQHKWQRKRAADSDTVDPEEDDTSDKSDDFKIKTLDEILQEKRRRTEKDGTVEEEGRGSGGNSRNASPVTSTKRESRTSSRHESPTEGEVIYQLSPEQISLSPTSSASGTPSKVRHLSARDDEVGVRTKRGRKPTEEEEGEIVSDPSDSEGRKGGKRRRPSSTAVAVHVDENRKDSKEKVTVVVKKSEDLSEDDSSEGAVSNSEDDTETKAATKRVTKETKEAAVEEKKESSESEAEESGSDDDDESDDDDDDEEEDEEEEKGEKGTQGDKNDKRQKEAEVKATKSEEQVKIVAHKEEEASSSEEEEGSEDDSDEEESESESETSEESEQEEVEVKEQKEQVTKTVQKEETEAEDLHKDLQQLKRSKQTDERRKQKTNTQQYQQEARVDRRRDQRSSDIRTDRERNVYEKVKRGSENREERSHFRSETKSRPHEKGGQVEKKTRVKEKEIFDKEYKSSTSSKESSVGKSEKLGQREKRPEMEVERGKKSLRKDSGKHSSPKHSSPTESAKLETKSKERKDRSRGSRRDVSSEKGTNGKKTSAQDSVSDKPVKDEGASLVLTERERRQFTNEVVDLESDDSSVEDEQATPHLDSEVKLVANYSDEEQEENHQEEKQTKLPVYYPAVRGCRDVEEFQWLNRIEEGTYGVVYRAKDKKTGDVVALKKLKMEREKEGFPITSLREINTLLKAQHPNIVTVREIVVGNNMDKIYIVMDYVEHDLKVLMEHMTQGFRIGEVKTLMIQLLRAVAHLHDNWILHRDLKASNLLLSNKGILKVGDFGLAREYGSPLKNYTPIVVTLWYRAPELLLGTKMYSTPIDLWSVGCIFAELLTMKALFPGKSEIDQINRIFKELGTPSDKIWPGPPSYSELPAVQKMTFTEYPFNNLRNKFGTYLTDKGFDLLNRFLTYDPKRRITADDALKHEYFLNESPQPVDPSMFPTWPAKSEMMKRPKKKEYEHSPQAPQGGEMFSKLADEGDSGGGGSQGSGFHMPTSQKGSAAVAGFMLKFSL